jgi:hypothetical protein
MGIRKQVKGGCAMKVEQREILRLVEYEFVVTMDSEEAESLRDALAPLSTNYVLYKKLDDYLKGKIQ